MIDLTGDSQARGIAGSRMQVCPLCQKQFTQAEIEEHAAMCQVDDNADDTEGGALPHQSSTKDHVSSVPYRARNAIESTRYSSRELEVLSDSPDGDEEEKEKEEKEEKEEGEKEEEEEGDVPKMATPSLVHPSAEGGFVVNMDTVSDSPIKSFRKISDQADSELYYQLPLASGRGGEPTHHCTGQDGKKSQPSHKRGNKWNTIRGNYSYRKGPRASRGKGKSAAKLH